MYSVIPGKCCQAVWPQTVIRLITALLKTHCRVENLYFYTYMETQEQGMKQSD